jgi:hypothetical protein
LQEIQQELAALEHSEHQDQQRAVAMAEEHMHFLQSAGGSTVPPLHGAAEDAAAQLSVTHAQQAQRLRQLDPLHSAANMQVHDHDICCCALQASQQSWCASCQQPQSRIPIRHPVLSFAGDEAVLCPVCKSTHLAQRHGRLVCPAEGWQLNLAAESLQLSDVKGRLAAAYEVGGDNSFSQTCCA